jgi:hypothetical protein
MTRSQCSKRTAQIAIKRACERGVLVHHQGQYRLPYSPLGLQPGRAGCKACLPAQCRPED